MEPLMKLVTLTKALSNMSDAWAEQRPPRQHQGCHQVSSWGRIRW
jgi:hypothetical protein